MPTPGAVTLPASSVCDVFPAGTLVSVYQGSSHAAGATTPPGGVAVTTATVDGSTGLAFTGLADGQNYVAAALVAGAWRFIHFTCNAGFAAAVKWPAKVAARRAALGTS